MHRPRRTLPVAGIIVVLTLAFPAWRPLGIGNVAHAASTSCTQYAPGVSVDNTWEWATPGSWGLPGQQVKYAIDVRNYDVGCASASFVISVSTASGFSVSVPTNTIALKSYSSGYLWAYITSPSVIADGDYPVTVSVQRVGTSAPTATSSSSYKVYSSDTVAPTLYWPNPADGGSISAAKGKSSYNVVVSSNDDHAVKKIDLYLDNVYTSTTVCDNISYDCQLVYKWSLSGVHGQHTATFKSTDWMGNLGVLSVSFTVS